MAFNTDDRGFSYTLMDNGRFGTIRGVAVPEGVIAAPDLAAVPPKSREITPRAIALTAGIFEFAQRSNQPEPKVGEE